MAGPEDLVEQAGAGYCQVLFLQGHESGGGCPVVVGQFEAEAVGFVFVVAAWHRQSRRWPQVRRRPASPRSWLEYSARHAEQFNEEPNLDTLAAAWIERRQRTHRAAKDCGYRWKLHLAPAFGRMKPHEVDAAKLRRFIEGKLAEGLSPTTVGHCIRQLSTFYADIIEAGHAQSNPVASLPRSTRRKCSPRSWAILLRPRPSITRTLPRTSSEPRLSTWWRWIFPNRQRLCYLFATFPAHLGREWAERSRITQRGSGCN